MRRSDELESSAAGETSDEALVAEAREGRVRALDVLIRRHEARVLRLLRLLGVVPADREDVAQEVFLRVFRHLDGFHPGRPFTAWLYRIAVNAAHDHRRRVHRRGRQEVGWSEVLDRKLQDVAAPVAQPSDPADERRRLEAALESLTDRERAVFVLREVEGLETVEIARALGITRITVRRHLGGARRRLRRALATR